MILARASDFCDMAGSALATLAPMDTGLSEVGERIRDLAAKLSPGVTSVTDLYRLFEAECKKRELRQIPSRQSVSNWWHGKNYPSMDVLPVLAAVLGTEQEYVLFGTKRGDQLKQERQFLQRVSEDEAKLLTAYREASKAGQKMIAKTARNIADESPAPEASVHPMRRKEDRLRN